MQRHFLNERVLSAIVEFKTTLDRVPELLRKIRTVAAGLETVVLVGVSTRCDPSGESLLEEILQREGFAFNRGKTNLGLGHALHQVH